MSKLLSEVAKVRDSRSADYDTPENNLGLTAKLWSVVLKREVTAKEVALCLVQLKVAREIYKHKKDNLVDAIGYLDALSEIEGDVFS